MELPDLLPTTDEPTDSQTDIGLPDLFPEGQDDGGLERNIRFDAGINPDQAASDMSLAETSGLDRGFVERNRSQVQQDFNQQSVLTKTEKAPGTRRYLSNPDNMAVSSDDTDSFVSFEGLINSGKKALSVLDDFADQTSQAYHAGEEQVELSQIRYRQLMGQNDVEMDNRVRQIHDNMDVRAQHDSFLSKAWFGFTELIPQLQEQIKAGVGTGLQTAMGAGGAVALVGQLGPQAALPEEVITVPAASLVGFGIGMTQGPVETSFRLEAGGAYDEFLSFRDEDGKPLDPDVARVAAVAAGGVNAGLEMFQLKTALKSVPGGDRILSVFTTEGIKNALKQRTIREAFTKAVKSYGKTWTLETLTEVAQESVTILAGEVAKSASDGDFEGLTAPEVAERLQEAAISAGAAFSIMALPGPSVSIAKDYRAVRRAEREVEIFNELDRISTESKTRQRRDQSFEAGVNEIAKEGDGEFDTVYIPAQVVNQKFSDDPAGLTAFLEAVGVETDYPQALETGGDIEIPIGKYASKVAGTPVSEMFAEDRRFSPDGMTLNEAQQFNENVVNDMVQIVQDARAEQEKANLISTEAQEISDSIRQRLVDIGRPEKEANANADVWNAFLTTWSERGYIESPRAALETFNALNVDIAAGGKPGFQVSTEGDTLFQDRGALLGTTTFDTPSGRPLVELYEQANPSTFLHESGHVWLNAMRDIATAEGAPAALVEEWNVLRDVLKIDDSGQLNRDQHELFAGLLERYFMDGKTPSMKLRNVLRQFAAWMRAIYQSFQYREIQAYKDLVPFFDRMFATDAEIAEAEQFYDSRKQFIELADIIDKKERLKYAGKVAKAKEDTFDKRYSRYRKAYMKAIGGKKALRKRATAEIEAMPVYQAIRTCSLEGGLIIDSLDQIVGKETRVALSKLRRNITRSKGMVDPEVLAIDHGFSSVREMTTAMLNSKPKRVAIEELTNSYVEQEEQNIMNGLRQEGSLAADEDYHNDSRLGLIIAEYQMMQDRAVFAAGRVIGRRIMIETTAIRDAAREVIRNKPVRSATSYYKYSMAEAKAARQARKAYTAGKFQAAENFKRQEMLNHALVLESVVARQNEQKIIKRIKRYTKSKPGNVDQNYMDQVLLLSGKYGITGKEPRESTPSFDVFMSDVNANVDADSPMPTGTPSFSPWMFDDSKRPTDGKSYRDTLTYADLEELDGATKWLIETGRDIIQGRLAYYDQNIKDLTAEMIGTMESLSDKKIRKERTFLRRMSDASRKYIADHQMLPFVLDMFDGFQNVGPKGTFGPNRRVIGLGLAEAQNRRDTMMESVSLAIKEPMDQLVKSMAKFPQTIDSRVPVPEIMAKDGRSWTFDRVVAVALNMGNETNLRRLEDGYGLDTGKLQELTSILTRKDWEAVQQIWDIINGLFPEANEVHNKVNHFYQEKVKPQAITVFTSEGDAMSVTGGYYPIKYDPVLSRKVAQWGEKDDLMQQTAFGHPGVKAGMMKTRQTRSTLPLLLDLSVIYRHLEESIHYISHAAVIKDLDRITKSQDYTNTVDQKFGKEIHMLLRPMLRNIARPERVIGTSIDKKMDKMRALSTANVLGLNFSVAMKQVFSLPGIINDIGTAAYVNGVAKVITNPISARTAMHELSPYMKTRSASFDRDLKDTTRRLYHGRVGFMLDKARDMSFALIQMMDFLAVYPSWWGAYNQGMKQNNGNPEMAARYADEMIRQSQPSSKPMDLSMIQSNRAGWTKILSMFMTFTAKYGNRQRFYYRGFREGKIKFRDYARHLMLEAIAPPILMNMMFAAMRGNEPDEGDMLIDTLMYQFSGYVWLRDFAGLTGALYKRTFKEDSDTYVPSLADVPALRGFAVIQKTIESLFIYAVEADDEDRQDRAVFAVAELMSFFAGVPASKVYKNLKEGIRQYDEEDANFLTY